ncbi:autotransporter outer membrane beta-barrel domain-containing protein [Synechococcus sp. UW179B]|uniref:autotransporter outer membrane beta-barrel domain-containing protein n=1 Tax=Synechococcus sp. UW179B TaxID=2575516 RepID=UPI001482300D|nr:autotransporter outer membrane beta-barrel domain-containing protein [Synechococcus sp. UW179B]
MVSISSVLVKGSLFALIFASCCQQVSAQTETSSDVAPVAESTTSQPSAGTTESSAGTTGSTTGSAQPETAVDTGNNVDTDTDIDIDFGFAVDPGFGDKPNPITGNAPGLVDDLKSTIKDLNDNRPTVGWNEVEDLEDYCADDPEICKAPVLFSASDNLDFVDNNLDFVDNNTLVPEYLESSYGSLVDFHGFNTGFLIKKKSVIVVNENLIFGGAEANNNHFPENFSDLIDPQFSSVGFGALLITDKNSSLVVNEFLHFSTQCLKSKDKCPATGGNQEPIDSNDYIDIGGKLIVGGAKDDRGIRTFGGNDVFIVRPDAVVDVTKDINLGDGDDQFIVGGEVKVGNGLLLVGGNDRILNHTDGVIDVKGTVNMGDGIDLIINNGTLDVKGTVDMGDGNDLIINNGTLKVTGSIQMGSGPDWFVVSGIGLDVEGIVDRSDYRVDGGEGFDNLVFSDQEISNTAPLGVDVSQQTSSDRIDIKAGEVADRYKNFEAAIQYKGSYEYQGDFSGLFEKVSIRDGVMVVMDTDPVVFDNLELEPDGTIVVGLSESDPRTRNIRFAPITVTSKAPSGGFIYEGGKLVISADKQDDPQGTYVVIDGNVVNADALAANTSLVYDCDLDTNADCTQEAFSGVGEENGIDAALNDVYLRKGSLQLVVKEASSEDKFCDLYPTDSSCVDSLPGGGTQPLPGCEEDEALCDVISDAPGQDDQALQQEEDVTLDVIQDVILETVEKDDLELPLIDYGTLAKLVASGLLPRNVDAAGRGLFNYNNLLVDTVFDRQPMRQFTPVEVSEVVEEEELEVIPVEPAVQEPVRGLWSKNVSLDDTEADQYLHQQVAQNDASQPSDQAVVAIEDQRIEMDGEFYVENPSLAAEYAEPEGVRAWFRGFGGTSGATKTSTLYNNYSLSGGGGTLGVDVSLTPTISVGAFANYGNVSVNQYSGDTGGGGWNSDGWGGGVRAAWWTENFYVQGMFAGTSFSGSQSRNIVSITDDLGDETARGEKSATSYATALRIGAPFEAGGMLLEPQFTAAWTQNQENSFSENGADKLNLRYGSRTTNYLQTELGMKFSWPINSGETGLWVPSVRLAWLGDWDQNNESQSIGYNFTDQRVDVPSYEQDQHGLLVEGGLDYTLAKMNSGSWKVYVRGGAEVWGGERGTDWRASGGMTWQF